MNAPARYVARKLDPNALAIRDGKTSELYIMYVNSIRTLYANYQITIAKVLENDNPYFIIERETFSVKLFCAKDSVLQALVRSMLGAMHDGFELSTPSEFVALLGGTVNNEPLPLPPRRQPSN